MAEVLIVDLLAALEARDGQVFQEVRGRLNGLAAVVAESEAEELEDLVSSTLGPAWWDFVTENPDAAERFQRDYIGPPQQGPQATEPEGPAMHATQVETQFAHAMMRYGGLHLGPRFRTRASTYGARGFRPDAGTFF
mmetsp:Transcript_89394/g.233138  ORF Transcript_89394/g.233138 Transcript_89394/m.233138 type:complete len:137 (-) Transcript_89394:112-522(-)